MYSSGCNQGKVLTFDHRYLLRFSSPYPYALLLQSLPKYQHLSKSNLDEGYAKYSDEELITECQEYYPELVEDVPID